MTLVILLLTGCTADTDILELEYARRSILDRQTRMLTLRYDSTHFLAYDLGRGLLRKAWRGGVSWNGANFNNVKTIQPQSWGPIYWEDASQEMPWRLLQNNIDSRLETIDFKKYTLEDNQIIISYQLLRGDGTSIEIKEQPILRIKNGIFSFEREFTVKNLSPSEELIFRSQSIKQGRNTVKETFDAHPMPKGQEIAVSGHGSRYWLERSGCATCHDFDKRMVGPSYQEIANRYTNNDSTMTLLTGRIKAGSSGQWGEAIMIPHPHLNEDDIEDMLAFILSQRTEEATTSNYKRSKKKAVEEDDKAPIPGFGAALEAVHPSMTLQTIRPHQFKPRVGGMDFDASGNLYVSTWDSLGSVYKISGVTSGDTNHMDIESIASGLGEPLGLKCIGEDILVAQRNEITRLIDDDGDGSIDTYEAFCDNFGVTQDFHEYTYGLIEKNNYIYATLGLAMRLMKHELQHPDRGTVIKISENGHFEKLVDGLRQPNGIGLGPDDEIFITENQGRWVPACKLIHVQRGDFHGCLKESGDRFNNRTMADPVVWLPQDEIGNSPSTPLLVGSGLFEGQIIFGDVTHGGIKRVSLDKVNGQYQGCAFRFCQGLEAGINRMVWGPDGKLYVGGVGMHGGWSHRETQYGLQCLEFNDHTPMDIHSIVATTDGFDIHFTKPVDKELWPEMNTLVQISSWYYQPTDKYGGPKLDLQKGMTNSMNVLKNGKGISIEMSDRKEKYVYHFYFSPDIRSEDGQKLWAGDAWYTLNQIPGAQNL